MEKEGSRHLTALIITRLSPTIRLTRKGWEYFTVLNLISSVTFGERSIRKTRRRKHLKNRKATVPYGAESLFKFNLTGLGIFMLLNPGSEYGMFNPPVLLIVLILQPVLLPL